MSGLLAALLGLSPIPISYSAETEKTSELAPVAVLVSAYRPFLEAVEGLSGVLETAGVEAEVFTLEDYPERRRAVLREKMPEFMRTLKAVRCSLCVLRLEAKVRL